MISSGTVHRLGFTCLVALPFTAAMGLLQPAQAQNSAPVLPEDPAGLQPDLTDPNNLRPLTQDSSLLSLQGGQRLMAEASSAVDAQNYALATSKFQEARQIFNQLSNFYQQLSTSFSGIDNRIFDAQRQKAIETAELRDEATYRLALAHRAQNQPELAVPLLIQIIRSQNPTRDLGQRAYQQLTEMGFTEAQIDSADPNNPQPMAPDGSLLSLPAGQRLMAEASSAIDAQDYVLTAKKLQEARQVFNQLSNFHQQLATSFSGIDNQVFSAQRQKALESALLRDDATYQLALVHRAQNQPELAVPLLIQIIRSQNPTGDLGKKAYQQLFEIGFVDSPYPRPRNSQPTSSATPGS
jgi:hypothetical protein